MADSVFINVRPTFDMAAFADRLANTYRAKGFVVNVMDMNGNCMITFDKDTGGINTLLGLGKGIKATCMLANNTLTINFSDAEWTSKIIACAVGWFLCLIPFITGIIGVVGQLDLPKEIGTTAVAIATSM